jgi:oligopeptidase B
MIRSLDSLSKCIRYALIHSSSLIFVLGIAMHISSFVGISHIHAQPVATSKDHLMTDHQDTRNDPYYWMRLTDQQKTQKKPDQHTQQVVHYIEQENKYTQEGLKHTQKLQADLFKEITERLQKDKSSVPYRDQEYMYYSKYSKGKEYQIHYRKKSTTASTTTHEEILLDENELASRYQYFKVGTMKISPNQNWMAYTVDITGRRQYHLYFKNLKTNQVLDYHIDRVTGNVAWANDNQHIFYTTTNPTTLLSEKVWRHQLQNDPQKDVMVYQEKDTSFYIGVKRSKSGKFIMIWNMSTKVSDYHLLSADQPLSIFKRFMPRSTDHLYQIVHSNHQFYIITNHQALNSRLMVVNDQATDLKNWKELLPHRDDVHLLDMDVFQDNLVLSERKDGLKTLRILNFKTQKDLYIPFSESVYDAYLSRDNKDLKSHLVRYHYSSLTTPNTVYEYDLKTQASKLLKQDKVIGDFDPNNYQSQRIVIQARDGQMVPVSLVFRKNLRLKTSQNLLLYGYGSYGYTIDPYFTVSRLSLLDRGFIYAIAHVRGSQIYGKNSYEQGKLLHKKNTFNDFIDVAKGLIHKGYTKPDQLFAMGGSAGGLLMGAVINQAPELWKGVISAVPFVDVVTTMLDESIPLTSNEWDEWGNPKQKEYYDYMLSYSPYDQIKKQKYPNLLVISGFFDSQVQYWEPLKYVAKLRRDWQGDHKLFLHMDMGSGHGGQSGRYRKYKNTALEYAFILDLVDISN